jgi:hypothetical protein
MTRSTISFLSGAFLLAGLGAPAASAATQTVTSLPTVSTLSPGQSVYFDDKRCPAGMIAKFSKPQKRNQMKRACVRR